MIDKLDKVKNGIFLGTFFQVSTYLDDLFQISKKVLEPFSLSIHSRISFFLLTKVLISGNALKEISGPLFFLFFSSLADKADMSD